MKTNILPLIRIPLFVCALFLYCCCAYCQTYIAIGSSLSAGVRDGGLSSDRQQTAFPNLLAKQLGQKDFRSPSIENTGRLLVEGSPEHGVSYFWAEPQRKYLSFKKITEPIDNYAIPYQKVLSMALNFEQTAGWPDQYGKESFIYLNSFPAESEKLSYQKLIESQSSREIGFFSYELGVDDFLEYYQGGGHLLDLHFFQYDREGYYPEQLLIKTLLVSGAKGVILNLPQIQDLPFFKTGEYKILQDQIGNTVYTERFSKSSVSTLKENERVIPGSPSYNSLVLHKDGRLGYDPGSPLRDEDVLTQEELIPVNIYNSWLANMAKVNGIPIVDLFNLYERINSGSHYTHDNVLIDPSYPGGNFYSSDGIHPSALGHAVITNEIIKTINEFYKLQIELISIKDFANN